MKAKRKIKKFNGIQDKLVKLKPTSKPKKMKFEDLPAVHQAIIHLAELMENPNHDQYQIKKTILEVLGYEYIHS